MFQIISGTSKTVSGTQNLERKVPNTAHKNVPTNSVLLGTLFQLAFPVIHTLDFNILYPVLKQAAKDMGGRRVTVVLEIAGGADLNSVLNRAKSAAKKLAVASNVMIILSEANDVLMFGDDLRQQFIWVDGMTEDEATSYAKKEFPAISESDLKEFIEKVLLVTLSLTTLQTNFTTSYIFALGGYYSSACERVRKLVGKWRISS
jgi:hypothetical protein